MRLTYRTTQTSDLESSFNLIRDRFLYDSKSKRELLAFWRHLLQLGACISSVIEDRDRPKGKRQVGFGFSFFSTDAFVHLAKTGLPPFLPRMVLEQWKRKNRIFLAPEEIRRANGAAGLNVVVLNFGWDGKGYSAAELSKLQHFLPENFMAVHGGYHLKELLEQVYGPELLEVMVAMGNDVIRDYADLRGSGPLAGVPEKDHPYLIGFTEATAARKPGTLTTALLLKWADPIFLFRPGEQEILRQALQVSTDREIAGNLGLSPWTVKKRWQGVYEKVERADPEVLGGSITRGTGPTGMTQKRRHLLDYLRGHPEELRPFLKHPQTKGKKRAKG